MLRALILLFALTLPVSALGQAAAGAPAPTDTAPTDAAPADPAPIDDETGDATAEPADADAASGDQAPAPGEEVPADPTADPAAEPTDDEAPASQPATGAVGIETLGTAHVIFASVWSPTEVTGPGIERGSLAPVEAEVPVGTHAVVFSPDGGKPVTFWVTVLAPKDDDAAPARVVVDPSDKRVVATEGRVFADLADKPPPAATAAAERADAGGAVCREGRPCMTAGGLAVWPRARIRAAYEFQQPDIQTLFIGNNDGFRLDQARFGFGGGYKDLFGFALTFEGAALLRTQTSNQPVQAMETILVDAFMHYAPLQYFNVWAGQAFMPADHEGSRSRAGMVFTDRSVLSGGVRAGRGYQVNGLSPGREIGLTVGARDARIGPVSLDYLLAVSNGNGISVFGNDNKLPAAHVRVGGGWERFVVVGLGGSYNPRTVGTLPNLYNETDLTGFADLKIDLFGIDFLAQAIVRETTFDSVFPEVTDPARVAFGYGATAWLIIDEPFGLPMFGFRPGYRVSYYDPTTSFADDQLLEHTVALRYDPKGYNLPIALQLEGTMLMELDSAGLRPLDNNRLVALLQFDL
jgi:hypothetical protein